MRFSFLLLLVLLVLFAALLEGQGWRGRRGRKGRGRWRKWHKSFQSYPQCKLKEFEQSDVCVNTEREKQWWDQKRDKACHYYDKWKTYVNITLSLFKKYYTDYCKIGGCNNKFGHICKVEVLNERTGQVFLSHPVCETSCGTGEKCMEAGSYCDGYSVPGSLRDRFCKLMYLFPGCNKLRFYRCTCLSGPATTIFTTGTTSTATPSTTEIETTTIIFNGNGTGVINGTGIINGTEVNPSIINGPPSI